MLKYLKYVSLIILIIIISYVAILYINYSKNKVDNNNSEVIDKDSINDDLHNSSWNISKLIVYNDDETLIDVDLSGNGYIYITKDYVNYCNTITEECIKYDGSYRDKKLVVKDDCLIAKGEYDIKYDESEMQLSKKVDDKTMIYKFIVPKG